MDNKMIMFSIRPKWVGMIIDGSKTYELRRRPPPTRAIGKLAVIYATSPVCAVVCSCFIEDIIREPIEQLWNRIGHKTGCTKDEYDNYFMGCDFAHAIHIRFINLISPNVALSDLKGKYDVHPPQAWRWVDCFEDIVSNR